jgi:glycosyltransferase involved in cell wall biosynthesis
MNKPIKVLHIITGLNVGGAEMMLFKLCSNSDPSIIHEVISLSSMGPVGEKIQNLGIKVRAFNLKPSPISLLAIIKFLLEYSRKKPTLIQCWLYHSNFIGSFIGFFLNIPVLWNIRQAEVNLELNKWHTVLIARLCGYLSFIPKKIIICTKNGIKFHENIGYIKNRIHYIPNGFNVDLYNISQEESQKIILHVGRYAPLKDHVTFMKLAEEIHPIFPDYEFHMYGDGVDENNIELLKLKKPYIKLLGRNNSLHLIYPTAELLVSTSISEGFSNTIGEAMCCGVPVVATDVGESREIVANNHLIVKPGNLEEMRNATIYALKNNFSKFEIRTKITTRYDLNRICKNYSDFYESIT